MVKASKGFRSGTRSCLRKKYYEKGLSRITVALQKFDIGDRASVIIDAGVHNGMPHPKYQGYTGIIIGKCGRAYILRIYDNRKSKKLIVRPEHLNKVKKVC